MTRERTDLDAIRALCEEALQQHLVREAEQEIQDDAETVEMAGRWAIAVLGSQVAAALGPWVAVDVTPEDTTAQASVEIAPRVHLLYTYDLDKERQWLSLVASCRTCQHLREPRIGSLLNLTQALQRQGLR